MEKMYKDLADLMLNNDSAQLFYDKLPMDLKHRVAERGKGLQTLKQLEHFANHIGCEE